MKKKRFLGMSPLFVAENGRLMKFYTTAQNEGKGKKALKRKMNMERGCVPEAFIPGMEVTEIAIPKRKDY
ncbi:hypothetical protein KKH14_03060 [Patescibacteria group bacterium]|nr:hypothetical protein [Patescibacteria group bacterium]